MGWYSDKLPDHDGFVVGFVTAGRLTGVYRELGYPTDDRDRADVGLVSAGCSCGWRSPHWAPRDASWAPFTVEVGVTDEDRALELWKAHVSRGGIS